MRDYTLNRAIAAENIGASLLAPYRNWRARCRIEKLTICNDAILRDLGITRDDVQWAIRLPLGRNPMLALEERAFRLSRA